MSKPPLPAPTASAIGPCPTIIQSVGRPGTGSLPRTIAPPDHPQYKSKNPRGLNEISLSLARISYALLVSDLVAL